MSADLKTIALRWFDEWWNHRLDDVLDRLTTPDCVAEVEGVDGGLDRDGMRAHRRAWFNAVPDLRLKMPYAAVAEGGMVLVQWRLCGTHLGHGLGIPPSGKPVDINGFTSVWFEGDRIARGVDRWNRGEFIASLMQVRMGELKHHSGLTTREAQVALLMADRLSHSEIAKELAITPNTARRHCEKVLQKLGVSRRQDVSRALGKIPGSVLNRHGSDLAADG